MFGAVLQTCRSQQTVWENIPDFVAAVNEMQARFDELAHMLAEQEVATSGVSATKQALRVELTDHLLVLSKALAMKGLISNNQPLYSRNKISQSDWRKFSGNVFMSKAEIVLADAVLYQGELSASGITPEFISETQALVVSMNQKLYSPRAAIITKKGITSGITKQRQKIDSILNEQLDALILIFKNSVPAFFHNYQSARMVIETGGHGPKSPKEPDDGKVG